MEGVCECHGISTDITAAETRLSCPTTWDSVLLLEKLVKGSLLNFSECCDDPGNQRWLTVRVVQPGGREGSKETLEHLVGYKEGLQERCEETFDKGM